MNKRKPVQFFLLVFTIALLLSGCSKARKFDRMGWNDGDGLTFPNREIMLDDLLATHQFKGMKYWAVIGLLHDPQGINHAKQSFYYEIIHKFDGAKPAHFKNLVFYMTPDSVITKTEIYDKDYTTKK